MNLEFLNFLKRWKILMMRRMIT
jgi:hypothetical protein